MRDGARTAAVALAIGVWLGGMGIAAAAPADNRDGFDAWYRGDYARAIAEWRPAANAGDADAQFNLGQAYTLGRGVPVDIKAAESWYRKAALQGHLQAQAKYGLVLFDQNKREEAAPWLEKAAKWGEPRAELVLGTMLFNGDGVARDWPRAYALIVRAAAADTPRATEVQAQMDGFIPKEQRQQGLVLARQYEADAQRPQLPPEITGRGRVVAMRGTDLPPSAYDPATHAPPTILALNPVKPGFGPPVPGHPGLYRSRPGDTIPPPILPPPPGWRSDNGKWRVQLGAFADPANAHKLWDTVRARFAGHEPDFIKAGAMTRVLVGGYASRADAVRACGGVRPCVAVAP